MADLKTRVTAAFALLAIVFPPGLASAGQTDIDLFAGGGQLPPNIMIMLDSSGSMRDPASGGGGNKIDIAKTALDTLITTINPPDGSGGYTENARFGLFNFQDNGGLLVTPIGSGNTGTVLSGIAGQTAAGGVGTPTDGSALDVARYFNGTQTWGTLEPWGRDATEPAVTSPFDFTCRDSFMIYISDGIPNRDELLHPGFFATIGDADGDGGVGEVLDETDVADVAGANMQWGDDITWTMFRKDFAPGIPGLQNVTSHVIGFDVNLPLLSRMAVNGGGTYDTANSAATLATSLANATQASFDALASYSTAAVPSSRSQFGSAFYNAFFEPDANDYFWEGHLEAYTITAAGDILDRFGNPAIDPMTDLLYDPHLPHWDAADEIKIQGTRNIFTTKNGGRISFSLGNVGTGPTQFNEVELGLVPAEVGFYPNAAGSGVTTVPQLTDALVSFLHGQDAFDEDGDTDSTEIRAKVLGDIFHSNPAIVGSPSSNLFAEGGYPAYWATYHDRERTIYAGANDGMLHGFAAGVYTLGDDPSTPETEVAYYTPGSGQERFGYIPGLLLDSVKMVPRNDPRTYYFVDGSPVAADVWIPSNASDVSKQANEWMTFLVTGFREGGAGYIGLDVTDPSAVAGQHGPYPKLMWEFTDPKLGQAWSDPIITRVKIDDGNANDNCGYNDGDGDCREHWVMIVGGGYEPGTDPNHPSFESNPMNPGWTDRSKALFMVDIASGAVLGRVEYDTANNPDMIYGLPSRPAVLDLNFDGFADVVYIGDLGGQVWKWDISAVGVDSTADGEIDNWSAGVWFRSPVETVSSGLHYRSFFYPPAAAFNRGNLVLTFASGEREDLRYAGEPVFTENNRMYVINDVDPTGVNAFATVYDETNLTDVTNKHIDDDPLDAGYYFDLLDGEKFVGELIIFAGQVIGVSYTPTPASADPCLATSGLSTLYIFDLASGNGFFRTPTSGPMPSRQYGVGGGVASTPRVSIASDPANDKMYVKTSKGKVITIDPPTRKKSGAGLIYWKQNF